MRTKSEISAEIRALKALCPAGKFKKKTQNLINLAIEELEFGIDDTAGEWGEMTDADHDIVHTAFHWKEKMSNDRPSQGWGNLVGE